MRAPLAALLLVLPVTAGCLGDEAPAPDVLATFYPLAFLAERIGGGNVTVGTIVPSGVEPHDWEASPPDLARISEAKVVLVQGLGFEPWLDNVRGQVRGSDKFVVATRDLELIQGEGDEHEGEEEGNETAEEEPHAEPDAYDPHTWLDPVTFAAQARVVEESLARAFPEHAAAFAERRAALVEDLEALHVEFRAGLETCERRFVIANHDAYGYMAARYDFEVHSISGLSPQAEPDPRTVARLIDLAREHNVTVIYFEELASPQVAQVIAREVGAETRVLSPVEGLTAEASSAGADYFSLMRDNLANLRVGMGCE